VIVLLRDELAKGISAFAKIPVSEQLIGILYWLYILHLGVALVASAVLLVPDFRQSKRARLFDSR
jgi:hypothetical protein